MASPFESKKTLSRSKWMAAAELTLKRGPHFSMHYPAGSKGSRSSASSSRVDVTYCGDWTGNLRHGFGVQVFKDGRRYEGIWENDVPHGVGTLFGPASKGSIKEYEGEFAGGKRNGRGTRYYENGDV
jgi:hypothetical protein